MVVVMVVMMVVIEFQIVGQEQEIVLQNTVLHHGTILQHQCGRMVAMVVVVDMMVVVTT